MLKRSGGDAKAAFYMAAKEKGVDPNAIIKIVWTMPTRLLLRRRAIFPTPIRVSIFSASLVGLSLGRRVEPRLLPALNDLDREGCFRASLPISIRKEDQNADYSGSVRYD
jgi:hypothetical protein